MSFHLFNEPSLIFPFFPGLFSTEIFPLQVLHLEDKQAMFIDGKLSENIYALDLTAYWMTEVNIELRRVNY